jgi:N-methylhydantoinase B
VGGRGFGPDAGEVFEEGLNVPISKLFVAGCANTTLFEIIAANVRDPRVAEGDLYSLTACNDAGSRELLEALEDFGLADLEQTGDAIVSSSERAMRAEIENVPDGHYRHAMRIDGYDEPVDLVAEVTVAGDTLHVDFAGSSPESPWGINVPLPYTQAYASFGVRCLVGNDVPNNAGSLAAVTVSAPAGSILNAAPPRAVSARHAIGQMLPDVVIGCLAQALPDRVPAEGASCIWNPVFLGTCGARSGAQSGAQSDAQSGTNEGDDRFVINPIYNGGTGARPGKDGLSTTAFPSGVRTTPTEVNEVTSPLVVWRREYRPGSGGTGEYRGGLGQRIEIAHADGAGFHVSKMFDRVHHPARGRNGGGDGAPGRVYLRHSDGREETLRGKGRDWVPPGAVLVMETPGGGGLGAPESRAPDAAAADARAGFTVELPRA